MVESNLVSESVEEIGIDNSKREDRRSGISRDPSFSGWFDRDEILNPARLEVVAVNELDFDFKLDKESFNSSHFQQRMEHSGDFNRGASTTDMRNQNESYVPLDIENENAIKKRYTGSANGLNQIDYRSSSSRNLKNPISVADVLKTLFFILVWYTFSTFLTLYNKTLLGDDMGKFPAPLLMNTFHFAMQVVLSTGITWFWFHRFHSPVMSWKDYFLMLQWPLPFTVVPTGLSTAMDANLSNESLVFISVTFATMCKSAAPIFLLLFAFAFRLESPSVKLLGIILVISCGILLTVARETEFEFWGFVLVMLAAVMSGFRWTMTQILLQKETYGLKNPFTLMSYVTPIMAITTGLLSLILDPWHEFRNSNYFNSSWHIMRSCLLMLFGGALAFFMVLTEYVLVSVTSAVTVTIAGVVKEAVTILVAVFYFHDKFTWMKGLGLVTIMVGVSLFNWYKYHKLQKGETATGSDRDAAAASKYAILDEMDEDENASEKAQFCNGNNEHESVTSGDIDEEARGFASGNDRQMI